MEDVERMSGMKNKAKEAAKAAVSLATAGLSSCGEGGGVTVDPPPPPLVCSNVDAGQTLQAVGQPLDGGLLQISVANVEESASRWNSVEVGNLVGAQLVEVEVIQGPNVVRIVLRPDDGASSGSFTLSGSLADFAGTVCEFSRAFTFTIEGDTVTVALNDADRLPLFARDRAEIVLLAHEGNVVELEARTTYSGAYTVLWTVSEGELEGVEGDRARWRLPEVAGIYQIQSTVDYGADGVAFDAMMFEVGEREAV